MKVENIRLEDFDLGGGAIPYTMVVCDVVLDNGQVIEDVAENVATNGLDIEWTDSNIEHNEERFNDDQKHEVMQALSKWYEETVTALNNYIHYMNSEYGKEWDWFFKNGKLVIDTDSNGVLSYISDSKLEEIKSTSDSDYFNIDLSD